MLNIKYKNQIRTPYDTNENKKRDLIYKNRNKNKFLLDSNDDDLNHVSNKNIMRNSIMSINSNDENIIINCLNKIKEFNVLMISLKGYKELFNNYNFKKNNDHFVNKDFL